MTTPMQLTRSVVGFLHSYVDHLEKLKLLLALHGAACSTVSVHLAARQLELSKRQVRDMACELVEDGLVRMSGDDVELAPRSIADRLAIADLAHAYAHNRSMLLDVLQALRRAS